MKVFVTGGSGFIGTAVIEELLKTHHEVVALARSDASASKLQSFGSSVQVIRGDLTDFDTLKNGVSLSDGVIHLGFVHDFANYEECCRIDRRAIDAMCDQLEGTNHPFVCTGGTLMLPQGKLSTEEDTNDPLAFSARGETEKALLKYKERGIKTMCVRLSPVVHGEGDKGFISFLIATAQQKGVSGYIVNGQNVWSAVHRLDAAVLFRLAFDQGVAGHVYHGVAEQSISTIEIARAIGKKLDLPITSVAQKDAQDHFGFLGALFGLDNPISSDITRKELGWEPYHMTLLEDLSCDYYYN